MNKSEHITNIANYGCSVNDKTTWFLSEATKASLFHRPSSDLRNASINIKNQGLTILSGSWTDSDVKQKILEPLSNVSLCNNNEIDKAVKVEAPIL